MTMFQTILPDLFLLALFAGAIYAFLILPRQREFRKRQEFVRSMEIGTQVLTYGGLIGTIKAIDSARGIVTVEVADGISLQVIAAAITGEFDAEVYGKSAQREMS
jgi:preprotein translocase subunit YajC